MSFEMLVLAIFLIATALLIFASYHVSLEAKTDVIEMNKDDSQDDLLDLSPRETYQLTIKRAMPEIKALSGLLALLFVAAFFGARFEIVSNTTRDIWNKVFESMVKNCPAKLAAIERKKRLEGELIAPDKKAMETVIDQLERSIRARKSQNP